jgi:predicted aspartyl protease
MKRSYSIAFEPPAPVLRVVARAPLGAEVRRLEGKVDTGSDICALPEHVLEALDPPPVRIVRAAGFSGAPAEMVVFRVDLDVEGTSFDRVEVLATRRPYAIIGRNVLRRLVVTLDGPRSELELRAPRATAGSSSGTRTRRRR